MVVREWRKDKDALFDRCGAVGGFPALSRSFQHEERLPKPLQPGLSAVPEAVQQQGGQKDLRGDAQDLQIGMQR
jgi:hypothetical protein